MRPQERNRQSVLRASALCVIALLLASCRAPRAPAPPAAPPMPGTSVLPTPTAPALPADAKSFPAPGSYRIDRADSEIRILVYRAGKLASLGHNHVMVSRAITGSVESTGAADSSFAFSLPSAALLVDATQPRREEGPDFEAEVSDDAKAGTLHNMLGAALLDAAHFPVIKVSSVGLINQQDGLIATLHIEVAGHQSTVSAPFTLASDYGRVIATGSVELKQTTLGLIPLSLMLGALSVEDRMLVKFKIVANR